MPLDPAAGFSLDPDAALRERVRTLERQVASNPGAQAGGGLSADVVQVSSAAGVFVGPRTTLTIPEPGAFVQLYTEAEARQVVAGTGGALELFLAEVVNDPPSYNAAILAPKLLWANAWTSWNTVAQGATAGGISGGLVEDSPAVGPKRTQAGTFLMKWTLPGEHTYDLLAWINGGAATFELRNRRLFVRVVQ